MSDESVRADGLKQKRKMRPALKLLLLIVVPLLVLVIGWMALDIATGWKLEAVLADIRARGWPTELTDLYPAPIPDSENAAPLYRMALAKENVSSQETDMLSSLDGWVALSAEQQAKVRADLTQSAEALELVHQAAQRPACDFHLDYRRGYETELPHLAAMRSLVRLKNAAVIVALADGRTEEAFSHWLDMVAMVRHEEGQQVFICELVRLACLSVACDTLQGVVQSGQLDAQHVDSALAALDGLESRQSFLAGLKGELVLFRKGLESRHLWDVARASVHGQVGWKEYLSTVGLRLLERASSALYRSALGRPSRRYDQATGLTLLREGILLFEQPLYTVRERLSQWSERMEEPPWTAPLTRMLLPAFGRLGTVFASAEAWAACARTGLALERYRLTHDGYPATLDALVPDILPQVPLDPFDGKPLRYINDGKRVAVYSVGDNLEDEGGSEERGRDSPKDIVFTLRPARVEEGGEGR